MAIRGEWRTGPIHERSTADRRAQKGRSGGGGMNAGEVGEADREFEMEREGGDRIVTGHIGWGANPSTIGRSISCLGQFQRFKG